MVKNICISILLIFIIFPSYSWSKAINFSLSDRDKESVSIIEQWIRTIQPTGSIVYANRLDKGSIGQIKDKISNRRKITGITKETKSVSIKLTKQEQRYILNQIETLYTFTWKDGLFENSQYLDSDSVMNHLQKKRKAFAEKYKAASDNAKTELIKELNRNVFYFSKPIFIRKNTICLLYNMYLCGYDCGQTELCFYKLVDGSWEKHIIVISGIF